MIGDMWTELQAFNHAWGGAIKVILIVYLVLAVVLAEWRRQ